MLYQEPIYSVQQQSHFRIYQIKQMKCQSKHTDGCYRDYIQNNLTIGFGQIRDIQFEKIEIGKPSIVILSPTLEMDEIMITTLTDKLVNLLEKKFEYRKRYAIIHADEFSYIIGGYIFDLENKQRKSAKCDYKYNSLTDAFHPIVPLPNMTVSFGIAIDGKYIVAIGGHTPINEPLTQCYAMEINKLPEKWTPMPDLPSPTSGAGVGMVEGEVHVIGGFDIISTESVALGEYYRLTWPIDKRWQQKTTVQTARARPLVLTMPFEQVPLGRLIYVAGGYNVNLKQKPIVVPDLSIYQENENEWKSVTIIPDFKLTQGLSFYDDKLHISETTSKFDGEIDTKMVRFYDFFKDEWVDTSDAQSNEKSYEQ